MKKEYEPFLWKVLGDKEMRQTWVFAVALIGKTGDEKSLEKLFDWVVKNFPEWHAGERNSENIGVVRALTDFSNRGFLEATYIILSGTTTEFWRWLIGLKWPKTELDREILIQLAIQCSDVLPNLTHPEARTLIEFFGLRK